MTTREWREIIEALEEKSIKARALAMDRFRGYLSSDLNFRRVAADKSHSWTETLQSLFGLVVVERQAAVGAKASTAAQKRLEDAASLVGWTIEKVHVLLRPKGIKAVIAHLTQMLIIRGVVQTFAVTYLRALRSVISYRPRLEHLDEKQWTDIVSVCFAGTLGDKIDVGQAFRDEEMMEVDVGEPLGRPLRDDVDDQSEDGPKRETTSLVETEMIRVIEVAFRCPSAPFLEYSRIILAKFHRFFRQFKNDTSTHLPAVTALNLLLVTLESNDQKCMRSAGIKLWHHLLNLWPTKNAPLKEQVVMSMRMLQPFITPIDRSAWHADTASRLEPLCTAILSEPTFRWRTSFSLNIDHLGLGVLESIQEESNRPLQPFKCHTFRAGMGFTEEDAIAWAVLELGAEAFATLHELTDAGLPDIALRERNSGSPRKKRRKTQEPLSDLVDSLIEPQYTTDELIFRLQLVLFLIETRWACFHASLGNRCLSVVTERLSHHNQHVQSWAFLVSAAMARQGLVDEVSSTVKKKQAPSDSRIWDQVWITALRRIAQQEVGRSAAHAANTMLAYDRVQVAFLSESVETFSRDLDVQGPHFPSDAVCLFLEWCLALAATDVRISRVHLHDKILGWLVTGWSPQTGIGRSAAFNSERSQADPLSIPHLISLIARVCGIPQIPLYDGGHLVPDCPIGNLMLYHAELQPLRDFVKARVPVYLPKKNEDKPQHRTPASVAHLSGGAEDPEHKAERKISLWFHRSLTRMIEEFIGAQENDQDPWIAMSAEATRRHLELAVTALVIEGLFAHNKRIVNKATVKAASDMLSKLAPALGMSKWRPRERAQILQGLDCLFVAMPTHATLSFPVLLDPGAASGIPARALPCRRSSVATVDLSSFEIKLLRVIWKEPATLHALEEISSVSGELLNGLGEEDYSDEKSAPQATQASQRLHQLEQTQRDDDFGEVKVATRVSQIEGAEEVQAVVATLQMTMRGLVTYEMARSGTQGLVRLQSVVDTITSNSNGRALVISEQLLSAVHAGLVSLGVAQATQLLQHLGTLLTDYSLARNERAALVALDCIDFTAELWVPAETVEDAREIGINARELCSWYTMSIQRKTIAYWRVRVRYAAVLDTYLSIDRTQQLWDLGGSAWRSNVGEAIFPTAIIASLLADSDFRVRFRASYSAPALFTFMHENRFNPRLLFDDIKNNMLTNLDDHERVMTQILVNANIMIASAQRRRSPYYMLLVFAHHVPELAPQILAALEGVTARLGLAGVRELYSHYARYVQFAWVRDEYTPPMTIKAPELHGVATAREARAAVFKETASLFLVSPETLPAFADLCEVVGRDQRAASMECLPLAIAQVVLEAQNKSQDSKTIDAMIEASVNDLARLAGARDAEEVTNMVGSIAVEIAVEIAAMLSETCWKASEPVLALNRAIASAFQQIVNIKHDIELVEGNPPNFDVESVQAGLQWIDNKFRIFSKAPCVFAITHSLLDRAAREPFVDGQRSKVLAAAFGLSQNIVVSRNAVILHTLSEDLRPFLGTSELLAVVGPILTWTVTEWLKVCDSTGTSAADLTAAIVGAAQALSNLFEDRSDSNERAVVDELAAFLVQSIAEVTNFRDSKAAAAQVLWPWKAFVTDQVPLETVQKALEDPVSGIPRFGVIKALASRTDVRDYSQRGVLLWSLQEALDSTAAPSVDEAAILADLIYDTGGEVEAPGLDFRAIKDRRTNWSGRPMSTHDEIKSAILYEVLKRCHDSDRLTAHEAYEAAIQLFSVPSTAGLLSIGILAQEHDDLADILSSPALSRPSQLRPRAIRSLSELSGEEWTRSGADFRLWITAFAQLLVDVRASDDPFYSQLVPLIDKDPGFAATTLPLIVHAILLQASIDVNADTRAQLSSYLQGLLRAKDSHIQTLTVIVELAVHLRRHPRPDIASEHSRRDLWLGLSWVALAEAAFSIDAHPTALLFLELAYEYERLFRSDDKALDARGQALLYRIYTSIDEPDGFYGRETSDVQEALIRRLRHEGRWSEALGVYGASFEGYSSEVSARSTTKSVAGVVSSLSSSGFPRLAMAILQPARAEGHIARDDLDSSLPYDLAWRISTWDLPVEPRAAGQSSAALYSALRATQATADIAASLAISGRALVSEVTKLSTVSLNSPLPDTNVLATVLALREVRRLSNIRVRGHLDSSLASELHIVPDGLRFTQAEHVLSTRISILRGIRVAEQADSIGDNLVTDMYAEARDAERACLLNLSRIARISGHLQISLNSITTAGRLLDSSNAKDDAVDQELANVLWTMNEHTTAISLLESICARGGPGKALNLAQLGDWNVAARRRSPHEIFDKIFDPAIASLDASCSASIRSSVFNSLAVFADAQFEELAPIVKEKQLRFKTFKLHKEAQIQEISRQMDNPDSPGGPSNTDLRRSKEEGAAQLKEDQRQLEVEEEQARSMRWRAVEHYGKALAESDAHNDKILRFIAIWLAHSDDNKLCGDINSLVKKIPTWKFVSLAYQLSARLDTPVQPTEFSSGILQLVSRLCLDHTFHVAFAVNGLRETTRSFNGGSPANGSSRSRRSSTAVSESSESILKSGRAQAASEVINKAKKASKRSKSRLDAIELVSDAYREWAEHSLAGLGGVKDNGAVKTGVDYQIPKDILLMSHIKNLPIPISTATLALDTTCRYDDTAFVHIVKYQDTFRNAGGINRPRIVRCVGSDGRFYKELIKGNDDIRQDAVMQQVFVLVNDMLSRDEVTRRRKLRVRTYKVVPLQNADGILEFVKNAVALNDVLIPLYNFLGPTALKPRQARMKLSAVDSKNSVNTPAKRLAAFESIVKQMPPMMKHYFFRKHKLPSLWFDMRLNYSRSVATNSMVGHILGIGDRHVSNILMDEVEGELVSIDFGIAFEAGKRLKVPETVPFRLTQNIVDGLGSSGVEGVFRRCSEETLRVLRTTSNVIMTVLEVFKHDPLQKWAVSAAMAKRLQDIEDATTASTADDADRALANVKAKLDKKLSVEYTVNQLIQEATDPRNLSQIYEGWQPYL